jgi:hypothetical protein
MDALKRAVDLMDESAVKLSSARARYIDYLVLNSITNVTSNTYLNC